jgi:hypothetical protein
MRRFLLLAPVIAALGLTGCAIGDDGPRTTQTRDVAAFTRIDNRASVDVQLRVGGPTHVRVRAGKNVIDDVHTQVTDGTLHVTYDHHGLGGNGVVIEASVPKLTGVDVSGSGNLDAAGIDTDALDIRSDGSADIDMQGTVDRLTLNLDGSGDAHLSDLTAREARVSAGGSGDTDLRAAQRLDVAVDGSGDVRYYGDPTLTQHDDGSGDVRHAD